MSLIEQWAREYLEMDKSYENHINKFVHYIKGVNKADKPTKIDLNDVEQCIGYYKNLGQINTVSSMESHLESIKSFYKFLVSKSWATDIFGELWDYQGYKNHLTKVFDLKETKEREYFEKDTIKRIVSCLDNYLDSREFSKLEGHKRKRYMSYLILRLFVKITLIAPAKRAVICNIMMSDFSKDFRTVKINNVNINVPNGLRRDILSIISLAETLKNVKMTENDKLFNFVDEGTFRPEDLNAWFCSLIKEFGILNIPDSKTTYSVETLRNSVIVELIIQGFDLALISKISGISISSLEKRYYKVKSYEEEQIDKLINQGMAGIPYYSYI
jgi:hypothetical protein